MSDLQQRLAGLSSDARRALLADLVAKKGQDALRPLSHGQRALWFLHQLAPESVAYNVLVAWRVASDLDPSALRAAIEALAQRHPALRTTYKVVDGTPLQMVRQRQPPALDTIDASSWSDDDIGAALSAAAQVPFDLERGPVFRATLLRTSAREHVLALAFHHIAYDDWSGQQIARDLAVLYEEARAGAPTSSLAPLPADFGDYVQWQADLLHGAEGERLWTYWTQRLAGELPILNLPTSRPRPAAQTFNGASFPFAFGDHLSRKIQELARLAKTTPYVIALAAFNVLLHRLTGQDDILVGTPTAGRSRPEFAGIVGYLVNPVVLRADLSGDPPFLAFAARVQECVLGAMEHADYPFGLLVERLQPDRDPARSPIFQVAFIWDKVQLADESHGAPSADRLILQPFTGGQQGSNFDLDLTIFHDGQSMFGSWKFNTDLFDEETARGFQRMFEILLAGIASDPTRSISELPLLDEKDYTRIAVEWNETSADYPRQTCLHDLVWAQAARTPEAIALVAGQTRMTYAELVAGADRLADRLASHGVGPEMLVGICLHRRPEMVIAILAVLKAGGAYVPLDPAYPSQRLDFILEDAHVPLLLTEQALAERLSAACATVICVDQDPVEPAVLGLTRPSATAGNVAYVIYTSGSTGRPKGVAITHESAVALAAWAHGLFGRELLAGVLGATSICFDLSIFELFAPLSIGGTVVLADNALGLPAAAAYAEITLVNTVPSAITELLHSGSIPSTVKTVNLAGEPLTAALADALYAAGIERVFDLYGPSEDTTYSTGVLRQRGGVATIGRSIANKQAFVVDKGMHPVPVGVIGELFLGGVGLARGYFNQPAMTAERFVPNPLPGNAGSRLYRTGDLARYMPDGQLEFLGRRDHQVKIRGFRIELGEIETALERHPSVRDVVVISVDGPSGRRLAAYIVLHPGETSGAEAMTEYLRQSLPRYMVPSAFMFLDELPLSPNGKLDRPALPAPEFRLRPAGEIVKPRTATEEAVAGIWAEVLGIDRIGVNDSFFELGGHSLLATKVVSRLRNAFRVDLALRTFFERPTVEGVALAVLQQQAARADEQALASMLAEVERL